MTSYEVALLFHLMSAIGFFAGLAIAAAAQFGAWRLEQPREIAAVLGLARAGVVVAGASTLLVLVSGLWLIEETGRSLGDGWIALSLALLVVAGLLGAIGGSKPKRARQLAEEEAPVAELAPLLRDRRSLVANVLATAAALAILVLMVWRPD